MGSEFTDTGECKFKLLKVLKYHYRMRRFVGKSVVYLSIWDLFLYITLRAFKPVFQVKGADVGRANKHGIFIAANLYIVAVDFSSLSAQSGVCFILNKKKDTCRLSKDFSSSDCIHRAPAVRRLQRRGTTIMFT